MAQKGLSNGDDFNVMSENLSQFDTAVEFQHERPNDLNDHKAKLRNQTQDLDEVDVKDSILKGKLAI